MYQQGTEDILPLKCKGQVPQVVLSQHGYSHKWDGVEVALTRLKVQLS